MHHREMRNTLKTITIAITLIVNTASAQTSRDRLFNAILGIQNPPLSEGAGPALNAYAGSANTNAAINREAFILGGPAVAAQPYVPLHPSQGIDTAAILNGAMQNYDRQYREYRLDKAIRAQENRGLLMPN